MSSQPPTGSIQDFLDKAEEVGMPPEFISQAKKIAVDLFAGVSGLDMTSLNALDVITIKTAITDAGGPPEMNAMIDKVTPALVVPAIEL